MPLHSEVTKEQLSKRAKYPEEQRWMAKTGKAICTGKSKRLRTTGAHIQETGPWSTEMLCIVQTISNH